MAASTRALACSPTRPCSFSTFETVCLPTPASRATSDMVAVRPGGHPAESCPALPALSFRAGKSHPLTAHRRRACMLVDRSIRLTELFPYDQGRSRAEGSPMRQDSNARQGDAGQVATTLSGSAPGGPVLGRRSLLKALGISSAALAVPGLAAGCGTSSASSRVSIVV